MKMFDAVEGGAAFKFNENGYNEYDVRVNFYPRNAKKEAELMAHITRLASIAEAAEEMAKCLEDHKSYHPFTQYDSDALAAYRKIVQVAENESEKK